MRLSAAGFVLSSCPSLGCCSITLVITRQWEPEEVFLSFCVTYNVVTALRESISCSGQTRSTYWLGARRKHSTQEGAFIDPCRHWKQRSSVTHCRRCRVTFSVISLKIPRVSFTTWPRSDLWRCSSVINIKTCYLERSINTHCIFLPTFFFPPSSLAWKLL